MSAAIEPGAESNPAASTEGYGTDQAIATGSEAIDQQGSSSLSSEELPGSPPDSSGSQEGGDDPAKHWQKIAVKKDEMLKAYKPLEQAVTALGSADVVMAQLQRFNTLMSNPDLAKAILQFEQTGTLATAPDQPEEDEYLSEEGKQLKALEQKFQSLDKNLLRRDADAAKTGLTGAFTGIYRDLGLSPEQIERITPALENTVRQYEGTEVGVQTLRQMATNPKSVHLLVFGQLTEEEQENAILHRRNARATAKQESQARFETDSKPTVNSGGQAKTAEGIDVVDSIRRASQELGVDPNRSLIGQ